jgi:RHS repeat-associated protein
MYEQLEYTPYGELWVEHVPVVEPTPFRFTGKGRNAETVLYYYGARYLNPQTGLWLSADPAMGEYVPQAPINDEAKQRNKELPGMGGVFNYVNLHVYHYVGNNPVKYTDPTGMWINNTDGTFTAEKGDTLWGLQQETGRDWKSSDYTGNPEKLQVWQKVNFAEKNPPNTYKTINSTSEAVLYYYFGKGKPYPFVPHRWTISTQK